MFSIFRDQTIFVETNKVALGIFFKTYMNNSLASRKFGHEQRCYIFKAISEIVMEGSIITTQVVNQLMPTMENILFFDEADSSIPEEEKLSAIIFDPITEGLAQADGNATSLHPTVLLLRSVLQVIVNEKALAQRLSQISSPLGGAINTLCEKLAVDLGNSNLDSCLANSDALVSLFMLIIELFDKIAAVKEVNSVILVFFNEQFLEVFNKALFLSHGTQQLFLNTGNEKLTKQLLTYKECIVRIYTKMHIFSEWALKPDQQEKVSLQTHFVTLLRQSIPGLQAVS